MLGVALPFGLATPTFIIESFYNILKSNLLLLLILLSVWIFVICFCLGTFFTEHASIIYVSPLNCIRYPDATTTVAHVNFVLQAVLTHTDIRVWDKGRRFPLEISHTLNSGISYLLILHLPPSFLYSGLVAANNSHCFCFWIKLCNNDVTKQMSVHSEIILSKRFFSLAMSWV